MIRFITPHLHSVRRHGLVHISQLTKHKVEKVEDVVSRGDSVYVKVHQSPREDAVYSVLPNS